MEQGQTKKSILDRIPHAITLLFVIILIVTGLTYIIPAGAYERVLLDGRNVVVSGSYTTITSTPISFLDMFRAIPLGFKTAAEVIFIVLAEF